MLKQAVEFILVLLNRYVTPGVADDAVVPGNIALLDAFNDASADRLTNRIVASVINIEQEAVFRNLPRKRPGLTPDGDPISVEQPAPIYLNVYLLFSANNNNYEDSLFYISEVISFFQIEHVLRPADHPDLAGQFPDLQSLDCLIADLYSTSFEELNHIWGILGGKYTPSVLYKIRLLPIQAADPSDASVIRSVRFDESAN